MSHSKAYKGRPSWRKQVEGDHRLTPAERQILSALTQRKFINWIARIGCFTDAALAHATGTYVKAAERALKAGVELGHLRKEKIRGRRVFSPIVWREEARHAELVELDVSDIEAALLEADDVAHPGLNRVQHAYLWGPDPDIWEIRHDPDPDGEQEIPF